MIDDGYTPNWRNLSDALGGVYPSIIGNTESPIEGLLAAEFPQFAKKCGYTVVTQLEVGPFRYDFAIMNSKGELVALVECDGREFHSTPEQIKRDQEKDDLAKELGVLMFRHTGKEICANPSRVAEQIIFHVWPR